MAWLIKRGNTWTGCWIAANGKEVRKSTRVHVQPEARDVGMTARELKKLAQRVADGMEGAANGSMSLELALAAVRAAATGGAANVVTVGEYAKTFLAGRTHQKSYNNSKVSVESLLRR